MKYGIFGPAMNWAILVVFAGFMGIIWDQASDARDLDQIKKSGDIRICIVPVTPAYAVPQDPACRENCAFSGPVYREAAAVAASLGKKIRAVYHRVDWDEQFFNLSGQTDRDAVYTPVLLASGKCDVYPSHLTKNNWRLKKLDFAVLFSSRMMVVVNRSRIGVIKAHANLAGKIAAVEKNTSYHTWLSEQNEHAFLHAPVKILLLGTDDSLAAVETGKADFTLVDVDIALWNTAHRSKDLIVAFPVGPVDEIGWAFRKEDRHLRDAVQTIFSRESQNEKSELNRIWKEEFGATLIQMKALIHATK
ncbi:MAG: transporter substrate-binding domain-containing protein [Deltaproteobacteria bacterium]|nr:transporter substrate-binding domain-containing protein [Deltaproteobacteria bacterium]